MSWTYVRQAIPTVGGPGLTSFAAAPTQIDAGNLLIVSVEGDPTGLDITSVGDSLGNSYTPLAAAFAFSPFTANTVIRHFYAVATTGGAAPTVTAYFAGTTSSYVLMYVTEYSVAVGKRPQFNGLVNHGLSLTDVASPADSGPITTGVGNALLYGWCDSSAVVLVTPASWTARPGTTQNNNRCYDLVDQAAGTYRCQPTWAGSQKWHASIAAFDEVTVPSQPDSVGVGLGMVASAVVVLRDLLALNLPVADVEQLVSVAAIGVPATESLPVALGESGSTALVVEPAVFRSLLVTGAG